MQQRRILPRRDSSPLVSSTVLFIGFSLTGVVTTLLGPIIPALSAKWGLNDAQAGSLFTAQFLGSMLGVLGLNRIIERIGYVRSICVSFIVMAAGVSGIAWSARSAGFALVFCYGFALGINIPATNLLFAKLNPTRRAAALNLLNFAWGLGAVACPPLVALFVRRADLKMPLVGLSVLLALIAVGLVRSDLPESGEQPSPIRTLQPLLLPARSWRLVLLMGALVFLYVGTENAIAGWVPSYALRFKGLAQSLWTLSPSTFWAALLIGRLTAPIILRHIGEHRLVLSGLIAGACGELMLLEARSLPGLLLALGIIGAGLATVFPTTIAALTRCFGDSASKVAGPIFALAGLGGATLPWAVGSLSNHFGSLRIGLVAPLFASLVMISLEWLISRNLAKREPQSRD
jgi:FHS family glucose/mannose:H+ symporter-like MFS transporter